ncbi:hypothetical protein CEXT_491301 [Caerostris extrusa]|uniref:LAGLIDADG homing endonuclease n=1 Tax=Caerostris extrusa TaxID=172846 RepID=A0AAV4T1N8_CAEEX|nr:hypothetical protein CEXT_491301 [Caerostris extrusa]
MEVDVAKLDKLITAFLLRFSLNTENIQQISGIFDQRESVATVNSSTFASKILTGDVMGWALKGEPSTWLSVFVKISTIGGQKEVICLNAPLQKISLVQEQKVPFMPFRPGTNSRPSAAILLIRKE